jgi:ABC-type microcin C transport system duplicated ATPase subunit YejF
MKLPPEQIAKIEDVLTDIEVGQFNRAIIIKHDLADLQTFVNWLSVMRRFGIKVERGKRQIVNKSEMAEFRRWVLQTAADRAGKR